MEEKRRGAGLDAITPERALQVEANLIGGKYPITRAGDTPEEVYRVVQASTLRLQEAVQNILDKNAQWEAKQYIDDIIKRMYENRPNLFAGQSIDAIKLAGLYDKLLPCPKTVSKSDLTLKEKAPGIGEYIEIQGYLLMRDLFELYKQGQINEAEFCVLAQAFYPDLPPFFAYTKGRYTDYILLHGFKKEIIKNLHDNQENVWQPDYDKPNPIILLKPYAWSITADDQRPVNLPQYFPHGENNIPRLSFMNKHMRLTLDAFIENIGLDLSRYELRFPRISELQRIGNKTGFGTTDRWILCEEIISIDSNHVGQKNEALCAGNVLHGGAADIHRIDIEEGHPLVFVQLVIAPRE